MVSSLVPDQDLVAGEQLNAPNQPYSLIMQGDGNLVLYRTDLQRALWASDTVGYPGAHAEMRSNGFRIVDPSGKLLWVLVLAPNTELTSADLQDDGNFVIKGSGVPWTTNTVQNNLSGHPATVISSGRRDLFQVGPGGTLLHCLYDTAWHDWEDLGGQLTSSPAAVSQAEGQLDLFARGTAGQLLHRSYNGTWSSWEDLGGQFYGAPAVTTWGPGRIDVFAYGSQSDLTHIWYDGQWHAWESLGGTLKSEPAAVSTAFGILDVFVRAADDTLAHTSFDLNTSAGWSAWTSLGGALQSAPTAAAFTDDIHVMALGLELVVYSLSRQSGAWTDWTPIGDLRNAASRGPTAPNKLVQYVSVSFCDQQYADCCDEAEKLQEEILRQLQGFICWTQKQQCEANAFLLSTTQWANQVLNPVTAWLEQNVWAVVIFAVVADVVLCFLIPPLGATELSVAVAVAAAAG